MFLLKLIFYFVCLCSKRGMAFKLLFTDAKSIMVADFVKLEILTLANNLTRPVSVDYHRTNGYIYWSDVSDHTISRILYSSTFNETAETIISEDVHTPDGIAVDSINNHLYWTDTGIDKVMRSELDGSNRVVILGSNLEQPRGIALDLRTSMMYLSDWGTSPKIERCKLDGSSRQSIITTDIKWPNGLAIDFNEERIYWVDAGLNQMKSANLDGSNVESIIKSSSWLPLPFDIEVDESFVYYSDWTLGNILRVSKVTNSTPTVLFNGQFLAMGIRIYKPQIDGNWGSWSSWGSCSLSCGNGIQNRARLCNNPVPENGGTPCTGSTIEQQSCSLKACPVDGQWGSWTSWGSCSVTCENGTQTRSRSCDNPAPAHGGFICVGLSTEKQRCTLADCPVDGQWGSWTSWGSCSVTCENGTQTKSRSCDNPAPAHGGSTCGGASTEVQICSLNNCPVDGYWGSWTSWGPCSVTCDNGTRTKSRSCDNPAPADGGLICIGASTEVQICTLTKCPVDGNWGSWTSWGLCSVTCANGTQTKSRSCDNPAPSFGGSVCNGASTEDQPCTLNNCPVNGNWGSWTSWGLCSVTCENGTQTKSRSCDNPAPSYGGSTCDGASTEIQTCSLTDCPVQTKEEINGIASKITALQKRLNSWTDKDDLQIYPKQVVAFTAVLSKSVSLGEGQVVKYDKVITNAGKAYNPLTGYFTVPLSGIYSVSASMMGYYTNGIHLQLVKNGNEMVRLWTGGGSGGHEVASHTINVDLNKGDKVWVQRKTNSGTRIYGDEPFNVFSAALLFQNL